jgi:carbonic anhydrase
MNDEGNISEWNPLQFHFHTPSEHTINGENLDLEMHVVHLTPSGGLGAVLGIFFDVERGGDENNWFLSQMQGLASTDSIYGRLNFKDFLMELDHDDFWSYDGSLTTPPCSEGVKWSVLKSVQPISRDQLALFGKYWVDGSNVRGKGDNRQTQPLNGRTLYSSSWKSEE